MKKVLMLLLALAMVFSMAGIVSAEEVPVTYKVEESYEATIPTNGVALVAATGFTDENVEEKTVGAKYAQIGDDRVLIITMKSANNFNVTYKDSNVQYAAGLLADESTGAYSEFANGAEVLRIPAGTTEGSTLMKFYTTEEWIKKATRSAEHSDSLTFTFTFAGENDIFIGTKEELFAFANDVNANQNTYSGKTVKLIADIDLDNAVWTPVGQTGATQFQGVFDGQGHTISNLNIDMAAYTDEYTSSGLFGWAESGVTIQNVKIDGATVKGNHNVAVLVGYTYSGKITNCHVSNANIECNHANDDACGDKAGIIVGYAGDESRITDCTATDSTVTAGRDAGQVIGTGYHVSVSGCSATNVAVSATDECTGANINNAIIGRVMG